MLSSWLELMKGDLQGKSLRGRYVVGERIIARNDYAFHFCRDERLGVEGVIKVDFVELSITDDAYDSETIHKLGQCRTVAAVSDLGEDQLDLGDETRTVHFTVWSHVRGKTLKTIFREQQPPEEPEDDDEELEAEIPPPVDFKLAFEVSYQLFTALKTFEDNGVEKVFLSLDNIIIYRPNEYDVELRLVNLPTEERDELGAVYTSAISYCMKLLEFSSQSDEDPEALGEVMEIIETARTSLGEGKFDAGTVIAALDSLAEGEEDEAPDPELAELRKFSQEKLIKNRIQATGRYNFKYKLGEGGMGAVYLAEDVNLSRKVGLKIILASSLARPGAVERFKREAQAAAQFTHQNITQIYEIGEVDIDGEQHLFIVMEYVDGKNLSEMIRDGAVDEKTIFVLVRDIVDALHEIHQKGVIHRDIKPENIKVTNDGKVKLMDFGLATFKHAASHLSGEGVATGTLAYASPEQLQAQQVDERSDLYSLGIVLYELITGELPFPTNDLASLLYSQISKKPDPPTRKNPFISRKLERLVLRLLEKDPKSRFQNCAEISHYLESVEDGPPWIDELAEQQKAKSPPPDVKEEAAAAVHVEDLPQTEETAAEPRQKKKKKANPLGILMLWLVILFFAGLTFSSFFPEQARQLREVFAGILAQMSGKPLEPEPVIAELPPEPEPEPVVEEKKPEPVVQKPKPKPPAPTTGFLTLSTEPAGASVEIDGDAPRTAPIEMLELNKGEHSALITLEGYLPKSVEFTVEGGKSLALPVVLEPVPLPGTGYLTVNATPARCNIEVLGVGKLGPTVTNRELPVGNYTVRVTAPKHNTVERFIEIQPGQVETLNENLTPRYGTFSCSVTPGNAQVQLIPLDLPPMIDKPYAFAPPVIRSRVLEGRYRLQVSEPDHDTYEETVEIVEGRLLDKTVSLTVTNQVVTKGSLEIRFIGSKGELRDLTIDGVDKMGDQEELAINPWSSRYAFHNIQRGEHMLTFFIKAGKKTETYSFDFEVRGGQVSVLEFMIDDQPKTELLRLTNRTWSTLN